MITNTQKTQKKTKGAFCGIQVNYFIYKKKTFHIYANVVCLAFNRWEKVNKIITTKKRHTIQKRYLNE